MPGLIKNGYYKERLLQLRTAERYEDKGMKTHPAASFADV